MAAEVTASFPGLVAGLHPVMAELDQLTEEGPVNQNATRLRITYQIKNEDMQQFRKNLDELLGTFETEVVECKNSRCVLTFPRLSERLKVKKHLENNGEKRLGIPIKVVIPDESGEASKQPMTPSGPGTRLAVV